jgi:four helix bundle protein
MKLKNNPLQNKSYDFSLLILELSRTLLRDQKEYILSKQLLRSGTSVGANIIEANGAISKADFSAKISIAYKECLESKYWLSILKDSKYISVNQYHKLFEKADEIGKILFSILKTTRIENNFDN